MPHHDMPARLLLLPPVSVARFRPLFPRAAAASETPDALSCEPGLYIPGLGGARVENMIYVGEDGPEELTRCPLHLCMGG